MALFNKNQITIKDSPDKNIARYFISYQASRISKGNKQKSYHLLSLLKQEHEIILEVDTALIALPTSAETETAIMEMLKSLDAMGIEYRHNEFEAPSKKHIFGFFSLGKPVTGHRVLAYIPDKLWHEELFQSILPGYGARYYVCRESANNSQLLEDLFNNRIPNKQKNEVFELVIYDCSDFGQMGINTNLAKEEVQRLLASCI